MRLKRMDCTAEHLQICACSAIFRHIRRPVAFCSHWMREGRQVKAVLSRGQQSHLSPTTRQNDPFWKVSILASRYYYYVPNFRPLTTV